MDFRLETFNFCLMLPIRLNEFEYVSNNTVKLKINITC